MKVKRKMRIAQAFEIFSFHEPGMTARIGWKNHSQASFHGEDISPCGVAEGA